MSIFKLIRRLLIHNFREKLISLLIAMGFWGYFRLAQISKIEISIPVSYTTAPENLMMLSEPPNFINAELTGKENELRFSSANLIARVDLGGAAPGRNRFMANFDSNQLPSGVKIKSINSEIFIDFDKIISKEVPISIKFSGQLPETYIQGTQRLSPSRVTLKGPQAKLDSINFIDLKMISLSSVKKDINKQMAFSENIDPDISLDPPKVKVFVPIFRLSQANVKVIKDIPIRVKNTPPDRVAVLNPLEISLTIRDNEKNLQKLGQRSFLATISINESTSKELFEVDVAISKRTASKAEIIKIEPKSVQVRLLKKTN